MLHLQFALSLWLHYLATASSLSIPSAQQISRNDTSLATLVPTTSLNLSRLPPIPAIPGFRTDVRFAQTATVPRPNLYQQTLTLMAILAKGSEESVISGSIHISDWNTELRFVPSPSEPGAQAQAKHVVRALYEATFAVSELPYRAPNTRWHVARLYDGLYLHNKIIGFLSWRSVDSVGGQANTTFGTVDATNLTDTLQIDDKGEPNNAISPVDATNLTGVLQTDSHEGPDSVQKRSSSFTDPEDPNLVISYTLSDRECDYASFFSAVIEGIAIVSPNDKDDIADAVNLVSAAGDFTINLHGTETPSTFRWIDMLRCLCDIWDQVAGWKPNPRDMGFEVLYRGSRIAQGDTFTI